MRKHLVIGAFFLVGLCAEGYAQTPKWVIVRSSCSADQGPGAWPTEWSVLHSKCWPISQTAGQCAMSLRGSFLSKADCLRGNSGGAVQTHTAAGGMRDTLQCVPRTPTAEICGVSILRSYPTYSACIEANNGALTRAEERKVVRGSWTEKYRCEMSLD